MEIRLFVFPGGDGLASISPPCLRVQMALSRAGVEHETHYLTRGSEVRKVSVTGRLPAIEIDGRSWSDSAAILDELERRLPAAELAPSDPVERMRDRLWEHYFNDHVYWLGFYLRWLSPDRERWIAALFGRAPLLVRAFAPPVLRRSTRERARHVGIAGKRPEEIAQAYAVALSTYETGLADGPFLEGRAAPGRGDVAAAATVAQAGFRDTLPAAQRQIRACTAVVEHIRQVFTACSMDVPRWLRD